MSMYGTRDAALNWAKAVESAMTGLGFRKGKASACNYRRPARKIDATVHGDDFLIVGSEADLKWVIEGIKKQFDIKSDILGPELGMKQQMMFLNRRLSWTSEGITYEADSKHVDLYRKNLRWKFASQSELP